MPSPRVQFLTPFPLCPFPHRLPSKLAPLSRGEPHTAHLNSSLLVIVTKIPGRSNSRRRGLCGLVTRGTIPRGGERVTKETVWSVVIGACCRIVHILTEQEAERKGQARTLIVLAMTHICLLGYVPVSLASQNSATSWRHTCRHWSQRGQLTTNCNNDLWKVDKCPRNPCSGL